MKNRNTVEKLVSGMTNVKVRGGRSGDSFFSHTRWLYVTNSFTQLVPTGVRPRSLNETVMDIEERTLHETTISYLDVGDSFLEEPVILKKLPEGYVFENPKAFRTRLALLLIDQREGDGVLLSRGQMNVLSVATEGKTLAVIAEWNMAKCVWCISARYQHDSWMIRRARYFSAGAA